MGLFQDNIQIIIFNFKIRNIGIAAVGRHPPLYGDKLPDKLFYAERKNGNKNIIPINMRYDYKILL